MVPWPEIMMTSGGSTSSRMASRVSRPSMPGSQMSSRTTSNAALRSRSRQASPLSAEEAEYPSSTRMPASESRIPASSSTMRMLCMLRRGPSGRGFGDDRQFNDEAGADGTVLLHADGAVMVFDDAVHDGQAQPRATFLGREVRQEEFLLEFAGNSVSGIGYGDFNGIAAGHQRGGNLDFTKDGILQSFSGVIHQIGNGAFDGFAVGHHLG